MDSDQQEQTAPSGDQQSDDSGAPAQTVRVPNVSPGAKSGLDHEVIGSDALDPSSNDDSTDTDDDGDSDQQSGDQSLTGSGAPEGQQVEGQIEQSDTAGTGDATNADTGQTTPGGQQLPDAPGQGDGDTLPSPANAPGVPDDGGQSPQQAAEGAPSQSGQGGDEGTAPSDSQPS